jgi:hypothetical protein
VKPTSDFEINSIESDYDIDNDLLSWKFGFYPTFGTKYPYSDPLKDATQKASTPEIIKIEELERQLLDALDKLADRQNNV